MASSQSPSDPHVPWQIWALSLFPDMLPGPLGYSLAGRALENGVWQLTTQDIREFAVDRHGSVDDTPMGGGVGMVMRPDVLANALDHVIQDASDFYRQNELTGDIPIVYLSPRGRRFDQTMARRFASAPGLIALCGRFEGVDQRVLDARNIEEVSMGDFILSGGEPALICMLDAVIRLLPGVIGDPTALDEESFANGLLEYPHFTRPQVWENREVPEVLLSGHHKRIQDWRLEQAKTLTKSRRPDLWQQYLKNNNEE